MRTPRHLDCLARHLGAGAVADRTYYGRARLIAKLERLLKAERARGLARHWSYELARHRALYDAWRIEKAAFERHFPITPRSGKPCGPNVSGPPFAASLVLAATDDDARPEKPRHGSEADAEG